MSNDQAQVCVGTSIGDINQMMAAELQLLAEGKSPAAANGPVLLECVLREVAYKDRQYIPVSEAVMKPGETIYRGYFNTQKERHGPSGSHILTICLPTGGLKTRKAPGNAKKYVSKKDR